jgi:DNA mismatch endonuclease, patch repair protein
VDIFDKSKRSWIMSHVKSKDTKPENIVRSIVHRLGFRFRKHKTDLPGKPDIVLVRHRKVIFVHGCFWHGHKKCKRSSRPQSHKTFWAVKLDKKIDRDKKNKRELELLGWKVLIVWSCEIINVDKIRNKLIKFLGKKKGILHAEKPA